MSQAIVEAKFIDVDAYGVSNPWQKVIEWDKSRLVYFYIKLNTLYQITPMHIEITH